ncbi:MAG: thioredoxin [Clostridia bacterium]
MAMNITKQNFEAEVMNSDLPVLIDFTAAWCGPCRMMGPVIDELTTDLAGKVKVCKVDVDAETELAQQFKVMSIPTLVVIENGKVKKSALGFQSKEKVMELLR